MIGVLKYLGVKVARVQLCLKVIKNIRWIDGCIEGCVVMFIEN